MKKNLFFALCCILLFLPSSHVNAQYIMTIAGNGTAGYTGDGGAATAAELNGPPGLTIDGTGNLYIADGNSNCIRKITMSTGIITTVAGTGTPGYSGDGGPATAAMINDPRAVAFDVLGNFYIAEHNGARIRKVSTSGIITTIAGDGTEAYGGDGSSATAAEFYYPYGIVIDAIGNVYVAEASNRVRKIDTSGNINTIAGTGAVGYSGDGGAATNAKMDLPVGLLFDHAGNLYISDYNNSAIRKVDTFGNIFTFAGTGTGGYSGDGGAATAAQIFHPEGMGIDASGNFFISDLDNERIRKINSSGVISTVCGTGTGGFSGDGGPATAAQIHFPRNMAINSNGNLYFADDFNNRIRMISATNHVPEFTGGHFQSIFVCENASATSLNTLLAVIDSDTGQTENWGVVTGPGHGTLVASFSTTSTGGVLTPSGLTYMPVTGFSGVDTLSVQISDELSSDTTTIYVTVRALPSSGTISGSSTVCVGSSTTLTESVSGGSWSIINSNASITGSGSVGGLIAGMDTIYYFVVNTCGTAIATKVITIVPMPVVGSITGSSVGCIGANDTLADSVSGGAWTVSNSVATISSGGIVTGIAPGTDTVMYTVTNICGAAHAVKMVTISPNPVAGTISGAGAVCVHASITLTDSASGGLWSVTNSNASVSGGVVTGVAAGTDTINYFVTNSCGTARTTHIVTINPLADPGAISGTTSICTGTSAVLTETVTGGTWGASNSHATVTDSLVAGATTGMDTIMYSVSNSCGTSVAMYPINISGASHAGPITGPSRVCAAGFIVLSTPTSGGSWVASNSNVTLSGDTVRGGTIGMDTLSYRVSGSCGMDTAMFVVAVDTSMPAAGAISGLPVLCVHDSIHLTETVTGGTWSVSNSALATIGGAGSGFAIAHGTDTVFYSRSNGCGTATAQYSITINPLPHAEAINGYDSVCAGSVILLTDAVSGGTWMSLNPLFASVEAASGHVHGLLHGSATIIYIVSNSCGSDTVQHNVNINVPAQPIIGSSTICQGITTTPSVFIDPIAGGTWSSSNFLVAPIIAYMGAGAAEGLTVGTTEIIYTVNNACGITSDSMTVNVINCTGLGVATTKVSGSAISIAPNPNSGTFTFNLLSPVNETEAITVSNVLGQKVYTDVIATNKEMTIHLDVPHGIYFISAVVDGKTLTEKIMIGE